MNIRILKILVIVVATSAAPFCYAGSYNKCVDAKGKVSYSDVPCPIGTSETEQKVHSKPNTEGERSTKEGYKEAARIYGDINRERKEENDSAQRYNKKSMESLASEQKKQNEHENQERTRKRYYGR